MVTVFFFFMEHKLIFMLTTTMHTDNKKNKNLPLNNPKMFTRLIFDDRDFLCVRGCIRYLIGLA